MTYSYMNGRAKRFKSKFSTVAVSIFAVCFYLLLAVPGFLIHAWLIVKVSKLLGWL